MSGVDKHLSILPMYSSMIAMLSPIGGRGWMYVGLASGRERVASVGVPRPNPPVWAVDEELTALVAGYASGDVDRLRLRTRHPVGLLAPSPFTCQEPSLLLVTCWFLEVIWIAPLFVWGAAAGFHRARPQGRPIMGKHDSTK